MPMILPSRVNSPPGPGGHAGRRSVVRSPVVSVKPTVGWAMARRFTTSETAMFSARSDFKNLRRAGVAENKSRTSTRVPALTAAGRRSLLEPRSTMISSAASPARGREATDRVAIEPMEGSASPRKPNVRISNRSSSRSLEVAWRSTQSARSEAAIPQPSSVTRIRDRPPPAVTISISRAPASSAFSTSSLMTLAGRSMTSPAAIRFTVSGANWRMVTVCASLSERAVRG